ncbi:MAG: ABC transporter ATP-binding protein [Clostridia bacterium]|nr:ABC transporter ATP-binding protein [Clostridia bacterium]
MIEIKNFSKTYRASGKRAVDNLSFTVADGEIFGFLGPNGAGKSTTIKCITGILDYEEGSIVINGSDVKTDSINAKKKIGYVADEHFLYEGLSGRQYVNFILDIFQVEKEERETKIKEYAEIFEMTSHLDESVSSYSHGMKQKISLIATLAHSPEVFILDEPMTGLDPEGAFNLKQIMAKLASEGKTVFFSSHVLDVVEKVCTRVAIIDDGKLIAVCDMQELKEKKENLEELFLKLTDRGSI